MADPSPLPAGTILMERFEILDVLGRGGFGIAYLGEDKVRCDRIVIKELAPVGLKRESDGIIDLGENGARLRQSFLDEAKLIAKINVRGILPVRATFSELGTAYYVTDFLAEARTLDQLIREEKRLSVDGALDIFFQILETLEGVHREGVLHRDIKPSNILVSAKGDAALIDFGSAREWHGDSDLTHTVQYTPGYAPPEQMSERARRGPATDIYALCATLYHSLAGEPPPSATDRVSGMRYVPIQEQRPDVESSVAIAIDRGLSLSYSERPQSVPEFRELLDEAEDAEKPTTLDVLDEQLLRLQKFSFNRRACPACDKLLLEPKPLKKGQCPVCTEAAIRRREIHDRRCPACRAGYVSSRINEWPNLICPCCKKSWLSIRRKGFLSQESIAVCPTCPARFAGTGERLELEEDPSHEFEIGSSGSPEEWRRLSGRSREVHSCDGCDAQFDLLPDGRLAQIVPRSHAKYGALYPEEWARVAAGLEPGAGNAECERCLAEFHLESERITLLSAHEDPNGFADDYTGRLLSLESIRWLGVGKESANPGFVCESCPTEFDTDGEYLRLIRTKNVRMTKWVDHPRTRTDWHRIAQGLPTVTEEEAFMASIDSALRTAYRTGEMGFDSANTTVWKGTAEREGQASILVITHDEASFGGPFRRWRTPTDAIEELLAEGDYLSVFLTGYREPIVFRVDPVELVAHLKSGEHAIRLDAEDLAESLMARRRQVAVNGGQ
jgi:serine/threonine protein kinase